jgi:hypothetical protein
MSVLLSWPDSSGLCAKQIKHKHRGLEIKLSYIFLHTKCNSYMDKTELGSGIFYTNYDYTTIILIPEPLCESQHAWYESNSDHRDFEAMFYTLLQYTPGGRRMIFGYVLMMYHLKALYSTEWDVKMLIIWPVVLMVMLNVPAILDG